MSQSQNTSQLRNNAYVEERRKYDFVWTIRNWDSIVDSSETDVRLESKLLESKLLILHII